MSVARFGLLMAAAGILVSGCGRSTRPANKLVIAQQWEPRSLNPALENGTSSTEWSMLVFSYLVKYDDSGKMVADAATAIPTLANGGISADGRTITYHIRRGIRFADGTPLSASDAAWSIDAINNPRNNVQSRFAYDDVASAVAANATTLVIRLKRPFPPALAVIEAPQGFPIFPKHALAKFPDFNQVAFNSAPFGSGPYSVTNWSRGDQVELRANPYYWRGTPPISHITIRFVANPQTAINLLRTHEVQGYFDEQDYANYPQLLTIAGYRVTSTEQNAVGAIIFNTQDPITSDPRVRHALAQAIDIQSLIAKTYRGSLHSAGAGAGLFLWAYDRRAYPDVPFDVPGARRLLDAAGWRLGADGMRYKNGSKLKVQLIIQAATPGDETFADNVVEAERAVGVEVSLKEFNIAQFVAPSTENGPVYGGKFQMALYSFENGDDPDTTDQFACANVPPGGYNKSRLCDARVDSLLKAGLASYDPEKRKIAYRALQARLYELLPIALIYRRTQLNVFSDRLQNQTTSLSGAFWNVGKWSLRPSVAPSIATSAENCNPTVFAANGKPVPSRVALHGPGLVLSGGGTDIDATFKWMHKTLAGNDRTRAGNVIVLQADADKDAYGPYIQGLAPFQSVRTIAIPHCASRAKIDAMASYVNGADAVFFRGGDQANYVPWKGSALIAAAQRLWKRGGVIGGTSAGLAVQGAAVYDSVAADRLHPTDPDYEVRTANAVPNPFEPEISFTTGFLSWPPLVNVITDSHFAKRDRFGRLAAFVSRLHMAGLGIDERSSLVVDKNSMATLFEYSGSGYRTRGAYLLRLIQAKRLSAGQPLLTTVSVLHLDRAGEHLNLFTRRGDGDSYDVTVDGAHAQPYSRNPYSLRRQ